MGKTKTLVLGATMLACTALLAGVAPAAEKGSEQGVIAIIKPGEAGLPYIEKRKAAKRLNPRMQAPPEPDKGELGHLEPRRHAGVGARRVRQQGRSRWRWWRPLVS